MEAKRGEKGALGEFLVVEYQLVNIVFQISCLIPSIFSKAPLFFSETRSIKDL